MSVDLVPLITRAGLAALRNVQGTGLLAAIDRVGIGRGVSNGSGGYTGYAPTASQTALKGEILKVPLLQGSQLGGVSGSDPIGFRVLAEVPAATTGVAPDPVNEVGWFLSDGTLLCVWSTSDYPLTFRTDKAPLDLAHDMLLSQLPVSSMTITVLRPDIPDTVGALAELLALQCQGFIGHMRSNWRFPLLPFDPPKLAHPPVSLIS